MIDFFLVLLAAYSIQYGHAAHYAPGRMEEVVAVRLAGWTAGNLSEEDLVGVIGFVAIPG